MLLAFCRPAKANWFPSSMAAHTAGATPSWSSSAIVAEDVSRSHILKIKGNSHTKGLGNSECITSKKFVVGGHHWHLKYYPDGNVTFDTDWVAMHLWRDNDTDNKDVKATFKVSVLKQDGKPVSSHSQTSDLRAFSPKRGWGFNKFIKRKYLEESTLLKDDFFSIRCDVTLTEEIRIVSSETHHARFVVMPPSDLYHQLLHLLASR